MNAQLSDSVTKASFASPLKGDMKGVEAAGQKGALKLMSATHTGMTTEEFGQTVSDWIATAKHPKTGRPFIEMIYQPLVELLACLHAGGFNTFIVSGGDIEFMRPWRERVYEIPPEQVADSSGKLKFERRDRKPALLKLPEVNLNRRQSGQASWHSAAHWPPSDCRLRKLRRRSTNAGMDRRREWHAFLSDRSSRRCEREWAYDRQSHIGKLDKAWDEAVAKGWTVVSLKDDWKTNFPVCNSRINKLA